MARIPITAILVLVFGNYELYRIHKGTHPYWSPLLEAKGLRRVRKKEEAVSADNGARDSRAVAETIPSPSIKWTNLNGVPIPTLEFTTSSRKDP